MTTPTEIETERRGQQRADRRKHSRSGRRASDPHFNWRRVALLFGAYAACLSIRSIPATLRDIWHRRRPLNG